MSHLNSIASTYPIPPPIPQRVTDEERAWIEANSTEIASRQYEQKTETSEEITLRTAQGDTVTLNYRSAAVRKNYLRPEGTLIPGLEDSEAIDREVSVVIDGDINDREQQDISALLERLRKKAGDINMDDYSSLSGYEKTVDTTSSTSWDTDMVIGDPVPALRAQEVGGPDGEINAREKQDIPTPAKPSVEPSVEPPAEPPVEKQGDIDLNDPAPLPDSEKAVDTNSSTSRAGETAAAEPVPVPGGGEAEGPDVLELLQQKNLLFKKQLMTLFMSSEGVDGGSSGETPGFRVDTQG
ncbi:MAG: hypothetical protein GY737_26185 [Desulfobacteraceae bacterium]|nr:hypothetical protein [Desulfobacteraceae bacterium]